MRDTTNAHETTLIVKVTIDDCIGQTPQSISPTRLVL